MLEPLEGFDNGINDIIWYRGDHAAERDQPVNTLSVVNLEGGLGLRVEADENVTAECRLNPGLQLALGDLFQADERLVSLEALPFQIGLGRFFVAVLGADQIPHQLASLSGSSLCCSRTALIVRLP